MENYKKLLESIREELGAIYNRDNNGDDYYDFYDWIPENVKSLNYIVDSDKRYVAVELCLSFGKQNGGANIFIETKSQELRLFSDDGYLSLDLSTDVCDELDEIYFEFYNEEPED